MTHTERLAELGITLPPVPKPVGSYVPALRTGSLVLTSGQLPMRDGALVHTGKVPRDTPLEAAADAASIAALNAVAESNAGRRYADIRALTPRDGRRAATRGCPHPPPRRLSAPSAS